MKYKLYIRENVTKTTEVTFETEDMEGILEGIDDERHMSAEDYIESMRMNGIEILNIEAGSLDFESLDTDDLDDVK